MKILTLHDILKSGKQPIVRFGEGFGETIDCYDDLLVKGMVAKIIRFSEENGYLVCVFDLSIAKEHNISLMGTDWLLAEKQTKNLYRIFGNPLETEIIKIEEDLIVSYYFDLSDEDDFPLEIVDEDTPMACYIKLIGSNPSFKMSYLEWLEDEWIHNRS
ncbi:MAG: hypothetical protein WCS56_00230 [Bacilli bacterium]